MIEDINAQNHALVDMLTFKSSTVAQSVLRTLSENKRDISPFGSLMGIEVIEQKDGRAQATMIICEHHLNPLGIAHGAVPYALADTVGGMAALSIVTASQIIVTQDMHYRYHGPVHTGELLSQANVVHKGTNSIISHVQIYQDDNLIGTATANFCCIAKENRQ